MYAYHTFFRCNIALLCDKIITFRCISREIRVRMHMHTCDWDDAIYTLRQPIQLPPISWHRHDKWYMYMYLWSSNTQHAPAFLCSPYLYPGWQPRNELQLYNCTMYNVHHPMYHMIICQMQISCTTTTCITDHWSLITDRWSAIRSQHRNCTKMTCPAFSFCSCLYPGPCWTTTKYCMHLCIATPYIYIRTSTLLRMHMPHLYSYKYDIQCTNFVCTYSMYVIIFPSRTALHVYSIFGFSIHLGTNQIRVVESFIRVRNETSHPG